MHVGKNTKMLRGAVWACVIPVGLGLIGLAFIIYDMTFFQQKKFLVRTHHYVTRPVVACFIFGTPLAAWVACWRLRKIDSISKLRRWRSSAAAGLIGATLVHIAAVVLYSVYVALFVHLTGGGYDMSQPDGEILKIVFGMLAGNLIPWAIITLPLSLICATIFWRVTKFPDDRGVF